jgi:succinyl-CoA synthetase alpha subunit
LPLTFRPLTDMILADENTRLIVQGITGREAATFTKNLLDYGSKVVAGVTPGKGGLEVYGVPVYDTVQEALERSQQRENLERTQFASIISVPPSVAKSAVFEALDHDIKLLVIVTERIPRKDVIEMVEYAEEKGARIIGPNSLGLISPHRIKIGMIGGPAEDVRKAYSPGSIGVMSRSGGMTTEIANLLTLHGIGQSTCVSIGGDPVVGSHFLDLLPLFEKDPETRGLVIFCEPGGTAEERLAEYVLEHGVSLPIVAFVAGRFADEMPGIRFGHAAVIVEGTRGSTQSKIKKFKEAGILVAEHLSEVVPLVRSFLGS